MCGIALIINYGEDLIPLDAVETVFKNMEARGDDAAGIYYERPDKDGNVISRLFKAPVSADHLWNSVQGQGKTFNVPDIFRKKWRLDGTERLIMLHTRAATKGPVANNNNNMPIYSDNWVLIHNGCVFGKRIDSYKYKGEVDSEDILANLETTNSIAQAIQNVSGTMAIVARKLKQPSLWIYRNSNPFDIVLSQDKKLLFGCSSASYILDREMLDLMGDENPFKDGHRILTIRPHIVYQLGIHEPKLEERATFNDIKKEWITFADEQGESGLPYRD